MWKVSQFVSLCVVSKCVHLRDVCIWVHSEYLWSVCQRQLLDVVNVILDCLEDRDGIPFVELEGRLEHPVIEPELRYSVFYDQATILLGECIKFFGERELVQLTLN